MAISVDWGTYVITVPKADTTLVDIGPPEIRSLDVSAFYLLLKQEEDSVAGAVEVKILDHTTTYVISGVTYARAVQVLAPFTITFEDGAYSVQLLNANSNIADRANYNQVRPIPNNSAGLQVVAIGSGVTPQDKIDIATEVWSATEGEIVRRMLENKVTKAGNIITIYEENGITVWRQYDLASDGRVLVP